MKRDLTLWMLLLRQLRDGSPPKELENYEEDMIVYNSALLIEGGFVDGNAIRGGNGQYVGTVMQDLTNQGHDLLEKLEAQNTIQKTEESAAMPSKKTILIFISHSAKDEKLATALVELLRNSLSLPATAIRCTSVNGYRLPAGVDAEERLRQEVHEAKAFIGLITPSSIASAYVMFELGARWGAKLHLVPLLGAKSGSDILRGPLGSLNALSCEDASQVHQLISDLADLLEHKERTPAAAYQAALENLVQTSNSPAPSEPQSKSVSSILQGVKRETSEMPEDELKVLKLFIDAREGKLLKDSVVKKVQLHPLKVEHLLDRLVQREFLYEGSRIGHPTTYYIKAAGRDWLISKNLI